MNSRKKIILTYIVIVIFAMIMCGGYITGHYSTDDYNIMNIGYNEYSLVNNLKEGRPIMYVIDQIFLKLNISYEMFIILTVVFAIIFTSYNIILLYKVIKENCNIDIYNKFIIAIIFMLLYSAIFNFMYIENLYFVESIVMSLSLLFYTFGALYYFRDGRTNKLKAIIFVILATFSYNGFECYFIVIMAFISLLKNKGISKEVFIDILKAGSIILFAVLLNFIQIKITCNILEIENKRISGLPDILKNILYIIVKIPHILINTCELFPRYLFMTVMAIIILIAAIYDIKKRELKLLSETFLIFICIFSSFCISIVSLSSFGTGRITYGIGMTIGIILLNMLLQEEVKGDVLIKVVLSIGIVWFILNVINYMYMINLSKENNKKEKEKALQINGYIEEYEKENNITISKALPIISSERRHESVITTDALRCEWACVGAINFYTKRNLEKIKITDDLYQTYRVRKKNDTDILCVDNILFLPIYDW